jgi:hypothetical protein
MELAVIVSGVVIGVVALVAVLGTLIDRSAE